MIGVIPYYINNLDGDKLYFLEILRELMVGENQ